MSERAKLPKEHRQAMKTSAHEIDPESKGSFTHAFVETPVIEPVKPEKPKRARKSMDPSESDAGLKHTDVISFNQVTEAKSLDYLAIEISRRGPVPFATACSLIALQFDISTETAKRYLRKHTVDHPKAKFQIVKGGLIDVRRH